MSDDTKKLDPKAVHELISSFAEKAVSPEAASRIEDVQIHLAGYAEPGYTDPDSGVICLGNWNSVGRGGQEDDSPDKLGEALDELGVEIEWDDEWVACTRCEKLVRKQPNSYDWQRAYAVIGEEDVCHLCIEEDPSEYLRSIEGRDTKVNTIESIDPAEHGYVLVGGNFENGLHYGQDAEPKKIGKALREQGIRRYLFNLDSKGQFDLTFSAWVHESERGLLDQKQFDEADKDGVSAARMAEEALKKVPTEPPPAGHVSVSFIDLSDGSVATEIVPREELYSKGCSPPDNPTIVE
jgi:hypothetical protein